MDLRGAGILLPTGGMCVSGRIERDDWRTGYHARRCDHVPLQQSGWHGHLVSRALSHEVPFHQPFAAHHRRIGVSRLQLAFYADHVSASDVVLMFHCWNCEDSGNVREYVEHPTVDDSHARHGSLLPLPAHHLTDKH